MSSYYGRPIVRAPVWKHDIPAYLFTGGLAAGSALLAAGADLTGRPVTRRAGRLTALAALGASTYFLVNDLGRPERFHHMLRVAKPTSPMSMGTWVLSAFGGLAGTAAVADLGSRSPGGGGSRSAGGVGSRSPGGRGSRSLRGIARGAGLGAAAVAPALATYTGVLLANTAMPSWHVAHRELPVVFAGSALASGAGVGLVAAAVTPGALAEATPARRLAVAGAALELFGAHRAETRHGLLSEPFATGRAGRLLRAGRTLTAIGVAGALFGRRGRVATAASGVALLAASLATRFGIYEAGVASAADPKYTVEPQRQRLGR
ncbi:NrfD/PsrC family molybdoenzyme membrane anchor subunit [Virgisporangium aurantiacum]|uniref:Polysulfide reductase n=1 Tax=Virgisporangium aurantiacum TaxID=175570 RepID=A0A8J4DW79_9ACTN|nr:NrfD/PsrC family molybdoenzyme membrane anchor subunit [Virgisporangium aurantiacum]GIJ52584.1 polysulfide reductase [Virgisporangium aurantiacum]